MTPAGDMAHEPPDLCDICIHTNANYLSFSLAAPHSPGCLPSKTPFILFYEYRWPFGRRAIKTHETPVFQQADTHTYDSTCNASTSPSPLCPFFTPLHNKSPPPPPPPTHTLIRRKKRGVMVTEKVSYETRTSSPPASFLAPLNAHARGRPLPVYRKFKMTQPHQGATIRPPHHKHTQEIPGYLHTRFSLPCGAF